LGVCEGGMGRYGGRGAGAEWKVGGGWGGGGGGGVGC